MLKIPSCSYMYIMAYTDIPNTHFLRLFATLHHNRFLILNFWGFLWWGILISYICNSIKLFYSILNQSLYRSIYIRAWIAVRILFANCTMLYVHLIMLSVTDSRLLNLQNKNYTPCKVFGVYRNHSVLLMHLLNCSIYFIETLLFIPSDTRVVWGYAAWLLTLILPKIMCYWYQKLQEGWLKGIETSHYQLKDVTNILSTQDVFSIIDCLFFSDKNYIMEIRRNSQQ